jgi:acetyl-CoA acetyltransferase
MPEVRWGSKMGPSSLVDPVQGSLKDPVHDILMGVTAENLAERMSISREDQDAFAVESHRRAAAAWEAGRFDDEIVPVPVKVKRETVDFVRDEHFRPDASVETMGKLKPIFKQEGGTVTARRRRRRSARRCARGSSRGGSAAATPRSWASAPSPPCASRWRRPGARSTRSASSS